MSDHLSAVLGSGGSFPEGFGNVSGVVLPAVLPAQTQVFPPAPVVVPEQGMITRLILCWGVGGDL